LLCALVLGSASTEASSAATVVVVVAAVLVDNDADFDCVAEMDDLRREDLAGLLLDRFGADWYSGYCLPMLCWIEVSIVSAALGTDDVGVDEDGAFKNDRKSSSVAAFLDDEDDVNANDDALGSNDDVFARD
jgi:hypothetical protein